MLSKTLFSRALLSTVNRRAFHASTVKFAEEAAVDASKVNLNFNLPGRSIYVNEPVDIVIIPGLVGEYGVTGGHTPLISEMKPGLVQVYKNASDTEPEKYFVAGGFAMTHENSTTDIAATEAVSLDDIDVDAAKAGLAEFKKQMDSLPAESPEQAKAQIQFEVHESLCQALGVAA